MERNSAVALRHSSLIDECREAKDAAMGRKGSFCGKRVVPAVLWYMIHGVGQDSLWGIMDGAYVEELP
jgi:hypothetical protein